MSFLPSRKHLGKKLELNNIELILVVFPVVSLLKHHVLSHYPVESL